MQGAVSPLKGLYSAVFALGLLIAGGCSSSSTETPGTGGKGSGGSPATGGSSASGGSSATGGSSASGGSTATGGNSATGGSSATGGRPTEGTGGAAGGTSGSLGGTSVGTGGGNAGSSGSAGATAGRGGGTGGGGGLNGATGGAGGQAGGASGAMRSEGCGKAFTRPNAGNRINITVGGATRVYQLFVPQNYAADTAVPLVVTFHGGNGSAASSRAEMNLENSPRGIVAYLNYVNDSWSYAANSPDIAYFEAVVVEVGGKYCVDLNRLLVTGFSLGAIQTNGIGCTKGGKTVRAVVPIDGSGPYPQPAPASESVLTCPGGMPVGDPAVMVIHGSNDDTALYKYGQWSANYWRKWEGCTETPTSQSAPFQGCVKYQGCRQPVYFCTHNGTHMVPSSAGGWVWSLMDLLK